MNVNLTRNEAFLVFAECLRHNGTNLRLSWDFNQYSEAEARVRALGGCDHAAVLVELVSGGGCLTVTDPESGNSTEVYEFEVTSGVNDSGFEDVAPVVLGIARQEHFNSILECVFGDVYL